MYVTARTAAMGTQEEGRNVTPSNVLCFRIEMGRKALKGALEKRKKLQKKQNANETHTET